MIKLKQYDYTYREEEIHMKKFGALICTVIMLGVTISVAGVQNQNPGDMEGDTNQNPWESLFTTAPETTPKPTEVTTSTITPDTSEKDTSSGQTETSEKNTTPAQTETSEKDTTPSSTETSIEPTTPEQSTGEVVSTTSLISPETKTTENITTTKKSENTTKKITVGKNKSKESI